eukprot:Filipodium_phascolosomae@DN3531_c0_g1_i1.p1
MKRSEILNEEGNVILPPWCEIPVEKAFLDVVKNCEVIETKDIFSRKFYLFGRNRAADVILDHPSCSRKHAAIFHHRNGSVYVCDFASAHGTFLNNCQISAFDHRLLHQGDKIRFGCSSRHFQLRGPSTNDNNNLSTSIGHRDIVLDLLSTESSETLKTTFQTNENGQWASILPAPITQPVRHQVRSDPLKVERKSPSSVAKLLAQVPLRGLVEAQQASVPLSAKPKTAPGVQSKAADIRKSLFDRPQLYPDL